MAVKIAGPARPRGLGSAVGRHRGRWLAGVPALAACAGLLWCYARLSATFPGGSDGASTALEAWDLLHGNGLLRGWTLSDVSFYTTELPEYAAVELARGLNPGSCTSPRRSPARSWCCSRRCSRGAGRAAAKAGRAR